MWMAPAIDSAQPEFKWGYIPFPGSDNADDNKAWFGKYDQGWSIAANTPHKEAALEYVSEFSDPANYAAFVNALGFIPTQPNVEWTATIGSEVAPYLDNFHVGWEQFWVAPKGAGQFATPFASFFKPFGTFETAQEAGDKAQADLQAGLDAASS
jgi:raffinose/stachyose/melibiose transport system substrate-binding protein